MDSKQRSELFRLEARLGAFEDIKAEIEPWIMEERDMSGREAHFAPSERITQPRAASSDAP